MTRNYSILPVLLLALLSMAQAPPAPQPSELQRLKLLNSYQRAVRLQQAAQLAQQQFDASKSDYLALADEVSRELKLPKGTVFAVDPDKGTVAVQLPPPDAKVPAAPEKK